MKSERIIVIDGSSYFFRAFYAIPRLSNSKGFPTNAVLGFINMLLRVLDNEKPTKLAIAFDTGKPTFRKEKYAEYKSNRSAPPEDLVVQIPEIMKAVDCFGVKRYELEGFEADDVIGTIAKRATKEGFKVEIITGDKDLMQLVDENVTIYDSMKDKRYDVKGVFEKFQVHPHQVVDLLALMGDSSDNIPGVTGIGEKTAAELIGKFGSIDGIYKNIVEIKQQKRRETLEKEKEIAYLSKELATVHCDVPVKFDWPDFDYKGPKREPLQQFLQQMEFQNLLKRFEMKAGEKSDDFKPGEYICLSTEKDLSDYLKSIKGKEWLAVDTETTSLTIQDATIAGISLCAEEAKAVYIPFGHHAPGDPSDLLTPQIPEAKVKELLRDILEDEKVLKVGQNVKYDAQILRNWGVEMKGIAADTLIASYLMDPEQAHNLDALSFRYLHHQNITYEEVTGKGKDQIGFSEVSLEKATQYSAEDADVTFRLHRIFTPKLKENGVDSLYREVEVPLLQVLAQMEYKGVLVDTQRLKEMSGELLEEIKTVEQQIYVHACEPFNINSPKQLSKILFEKLKLPVIRRTKTGISTDESVLEALKTKHAICADIVRFRELMKLHSTYVEGLLAQVHSQTGRVHTHYNQTVTATGRLSSSNPNLQNIPIANDGKYDIRSVFIAKPGSLLLSADYSQVELRLLASLSEDEELLRAFKNDEDIHEYTGRLIFGVDKVTPEQRRVAKTINFGVVYGQTPYGLSQTLKVTPGEAKEFIETYFKRYKGIQTYLKSLIKQAQDKGYVSTVLGRRRYIPDISSNNRMRREMAERAAINAPIQGSAADMIKKAMVSLHARLKSEKLEARMILQVHDELVIEVPEKELDAARKILCEEMEGAFQLKVPLKVDTGHGKNWAAC
jgi:DNA polymerase I